MPIPAVRIIKPTTTRNFGRFGDAVEVPPLTDVQTESYKKFLQLEVPQDERAAHGGVPVDRDRDADAGAAQCDAALRSARRDRLRQRIAVIGIIDTRVRMRPQVAHLMARRR